MFNVFLTPHNLKGCTEKRRHLLESTSSLFYLSVGSANNAASLAISDAQEAMEQAGLYTRNAKHYTKRTLRFVDAYEARLHRAATHDPEHQRWQFMLDYYDSAYDTIVLKLSDPTHINKAGIEALDLNPDVREQADKEE